jgi:hypothetical protein
MTNTENSGDIFGELRLIFIIYIVLILGYAIFIYIVYGESTNENLPNLLKKLIESFGNRRGNEIDIVSALLYVALTTLPLMVSALLLAYIMEPSKNLDDILSTVSRSPTNFVWFVAVVLLMAFCIYFVLFDWQALQDLYNSVKSDLRHCTVPDEQSCSYWNLRWLFLPVIVIFELFKFYFIKYKFPLTVASIILGGWAGEKLARQKR